MSPKTNPPYQVNAERAMDHLRNSLTFGVVAAVDPSTGEVFVSSNIGVVSPEVRETVAKSLYHGVLNEGN